MLVHNAKIKIQEEYARKEKEREINKRMYVMRYIVAASLAFTAKMYVCSARSAEVGASRRKKMIARDALFKARLYLLSSCGYLKTVCRL